MPDDFDYSQPRRPQQTAIVRTPLLTYLLCIVSVVVTAAHFTAGSAPGTLWWRIGYAGYGSVSDIWNGRYTALITNIFIHGSLMHIAFNMMWLWELGRRIEAELEWWACVLFVLAAAIVSSSAEILFVGDAGIGMSGVVYAMFGLMWAGRGSYRSWQQVATRQNLNLFIGWGILCVVLTYLHVMPVANAAHGGGFLFGLAVGWLFYAPRRQPIWGIPLALLALMPVLALTWMPWSNAWTFWQGNRAFLRNEYPAAIKWYQRSLQQGGDPSALWNNIALAWGHIAHDAQQRNDAEAQAHVEQEEEAAKSHIPK